MTRKLTPFSKASYAVQLKAAAKVAVKNNLLDTLQVLTERNPVLSVWADGRVLLATDKDLLKA